MQYTPAKLQSEFLAPLTKVWEGRIGSAIKAKERFQEIADQCRDFYYGTAGYMWSDRSNDKYFKGKLPKPVFQINRNKAFEYVSLIGPTLFWKYPNRKVMSQKRSVTLQPELFGDPQNPYVQQMFQQESLKEMQQQLHTLHANKRMETYLNWSQREYPGGALMEHARSAIVDALLTGMGCLWPGVYKRNGATYTKSEYSSVDNLFIDADCHDPLWETAGYIVRRHVQPIWLVERMFGYDRGYLASKGNYRSAEQSARDGVTGVTQTFDMIEWYECWSKVGLGPRSTNLSHHLLNHFDDTYGDNVYLCIAKGLEHPLNLHPEMFFRESSADIGERIKWHTPNFGVVNEVWKDGKWPVTPLWFHNVPNSPWPLAPMSPALGELIALNVLTSTMVDIAWENRKTIIACLRSAEDQVKEALKKEDSHVFVRINDNMHKSINEAISVFNRPNGNNQILEAIAMLDQDFNRRVGLSEVQYGESSKQVRVAADIRQRSEAVSVRPMKMADDVAEWLSDNATVEMFLAFDHVRGPDIAHIMGDYQAMLWDKYNNSMTLEAFMLEAKTQVISSEIRRPDKERDTANIQSMQQWWLPIAHQYAQTTTRTEPINAMLDLAGEAIDMDVQSLHLPAWTPPPPTPEQQQLQQAAQQAEVEKIQADAQKSAAAAQKSQADAAMVVQEHIMPAQILGEAEHAQGLRHTEENHLLELAHTEQKFQLDQKIAKKAAANGPQSTNSSK